MSNTASVDWFKTADGEYVLKSNDCEIVVCEIVVCEIVVYDPEPYRKGPHWYQSELRIGSESLSLPCTASMNLQTAKTRARSSVNDLLHALQPLAKQP